MNKGENLKVIVITWNRLEFLKKTMDSLLRTVPKALVYIYNNCSTDDTSDYLRTFIGNPNVHLFDLPKENLGWGKAVNESLDQLNLYNDEFVLLSNNDVEYKDGWYEQSLALYDKYPNIGILGLWKSPNHGVRTDYGDMVAKDQMPAVAWLLKPTVIKDLGPVVEHGPCLTKGGNGEDVDYCIKADNKGYLIVGPKVDLAIHLGE